MKKTFAFLALALAAFFLAPQATTAKTTKKIAKTTSGNPILPEFHADPEVMFSHQTRRFYIYSTTDGMPGWGGYYFTAFSSSNLVDWFHEGIILDLATDQVPWATGNAWAPAIIEKEVDGQYKYYFYYSGHNPKNNRKAIGVAVADSPTGPFYDLGKPLVDHRPEGVRGGQQIDVDVFSDPVTGHDFLYWGNGYMAVAQLGDDMMSIDSASVRVLTPEGGTLADYQYREAPYVFYRKGVYYFLWSVDDTGSPNYHVAYGTSVSPLGPIRVAANPVILQQDPQKGIYGTAHNSIIQVPGRDEWYIVYHRINHNYLDKTKGPGFHRQVCIDRLEFDKNGNIKPVVPTNTGVKPVEVRLPSTKRKK
ncbi:MAG: family 43 glycosylhydrolase [Bacteroidaceae bacterium]|nr:family 43 glycosylhydrolase [Bacteroidaceae bacterium]